METLYHTLDAQVSVFSGVKNAKPIRTTTIREVLESIRNPKHFKSKINALREEYKRIAETITDKKEIKKAQDEADIMYKKSLTGYTFAGVFNRRENKGLEIPTGFVCVDFDDVKDMDNIKSIIEDDYVFCSFISPSGTGIKALYKITVEEDCDVWGRRAESLIQYLNHKFRIEIHNGDFKIDDLKDASRLCLTSYDTDIYINENSFVYTGIVEEKYKVKPDYSNIQKPNVDEKRVLDAIEKYIVTQFSSFEEGGRNNSMVKNVPRIKSMMIAHQLDEELVYGIVEREYRKLFTASEWENDKISLKNFWDKSDKCPPFPMSEFSSLVGSSNNSPDIEKDIDEEDDYSDLHLGIFDSQKASRIPPEEELKLMTVDIYHKKSGEIRTENILNIGNFFGVVASASSGKTSVVNSIIAQILAPKELRSKVKKIHFTITDKVKRCLVFDSELDFINYPKFYQQLLNRINLPDTPENIKKIQDSRDKVDYFSMTEYSLATNKTEPIKALKRLVKKAYKEGNPYSLIILDDVTIFTPDVNDGKETTLRYLEFKRLARKYNFGIVATIHPNAGDSTGKARGHSGSELERKSETVLHITRDNNTELFKITLGVGNKHRNGGLTFAMHDNPLLAEWNDTYGCIIGIDTMDTEMILNERTQNNKQKSKGDYIYDFVLNKLNFIFSKKDSIKQTDVRSIIAEYYKEKGETVKADTITTQLKSVKERLVDDNIIRYEEGKGTSSIYHKIKPISADFFDNALFNRDDDRVNGSNYLKKLQQEDEKSIEELGKSISNDDWIDNDNEW